MPEREWEVVGEAAGELNAELVRGLLEAQGIEVFLSQEGAGRAIGLSFSPLNLVQVLVPNDRVEEAKAILAEYYSGELSPPAEEDQG
jgi:hypothetical protein